ncbi:butyrophilin subfamily 3 member A2-like, partial [Chrysemys picta bellii]|uniref:butyrophilin subfamily 3 member A2-like n=1 Tax=Chrysemys picta bellii TaxID=8478 RepID=UPI0032B1B75E
MSFKVIGPDGPIRVLVGEDALLPCHLSPSMSAESMEVRWFRSTLSAVVHLYRDGRDQAGQQTAPYRSRTKLLKDGIANGTVSLRIHNITPSDEGTYGCLFQSPTFYEEAALELEVAGLGSTPHLSVDGYQDGGIHVVCESAGWYPNPQVLWRDLSGQRLAPVMEKISQQADRLFDTHTAAVIRDASNQNLSCSVLNPRLGQERTATMHIAGPGPAFGKMAPWVTLYFGTLAPMDAVTPIAPTPVAALPLPLAFTGSPGSPQPQDTQQAELKKQI